MIDIATVVFRDELPILKLQAQSIERYCRHIGIRNIYVIVNDDDDTIHQIDAGWWGAAANHVLVVPRSAFSTQFVEDGWVSQQVLKILAASISHNTWTMVLDAKTIFVKELVLEDLIDEQGRVRVGTLDIYPVFETTRLMVNQTYDIDMTKQLGPGGVPFLFQNDVVRLMIADTTFKVKQKFPMWFQSKGRITEFMLYSGYLLYRFGGFETFYTPEKSFSVVNVCHTEVEQYEHKLAGMKNNDPLTVSIHRNAWKKLTDEQKQAYQHFLLDRGIFCAWELP
jgi:hypothetical protein